MIFQQFVVTFIEFDEIFTYCLVQVLKEDIKGY